MWNIYKAHIFPMRLVQTLWLETTSLCLKPRLNVKENFQNSLYFYWNLAHSFSFNCLHLLISIILLTRGPSTQKTWVTFLIFMFQMKYLFRNLPSWKATFHIDPFRSTRYVLKSFVCLEINNRVSNWNKGKTLIFVKSVFQIRQFEILELIYLFVFHSSIWISFSYIGSLNLIV